MSRERGRHESIGDGGSARRAPAWLVVGALMFPSVLTWAYFVWLADTPVLQRAAYGIGKVVQFGVPAVWWWSATDRGISISMPRRSDLVWGTLLGLAVGVGGLALWFGPIHDAGVVDQLASTARERARSFGVASAAAFLILATAYSILHAALEEAYWRGFAFGQLRAGLGIRTAIVIASLAFAAHHVILLGTVFGSTSPWTWGLGTCVALGGALWAWQYEALGSLWAPWFGHALIDAAIFLAINDVLRPFPVG